jgi:hypothetical protein
MNMNLNMDIDKNICDILALINSKDVNFLNLFNKYDELSKNNKEELKLMLTNPNLNEIKYKYNNLFSLPKNMNLSNLQEIQFNNNYSVLPPYIEKINTQHYLYLLFHNKQVVNQNKIKINKRNKHKKYKISNNQKYNKYKHRFTMYNQLQ